MTYYKQTKYICYDVTKKAPFRRKTFKITICRAFKKNYRTKQNISRAKSKLQVLFKKLFLNSTEAPGCLRVANFSCCFMQAVKENFNHNVYCITAGEYLQHICYFYLYLIRYIRKIVCVGLNETEKQ